MTKYQHGLCDAGRRAEGLEACREMALVGERAFDSGVVSSPTFGSSQLACRLAEDGNHAEAAALFEAIVRENEREKSATDSWSRIPWIAEMEAAGRHACARSTLQELVEEDREQADQHVGAYAFVIWEQLRLAWMDRQNGREDEAERCDAETEAVLTMLAADGEPKNWSNILGFWALRQVTSRLASRCVRGTVFVQAVAGVGVFGRRNHEVGGSIRSQSGRCRDAARHAARIVVREEIAMLASRGEASVVVRGLLCDMLDAHLQQYGYTRRGTSLKYLRAVPGGYRSVEFTVFLRPRYASPMSHVSIDAVLRFGPLMELAREMVANAAILESRRDLALRRPIDALRPGSAPLWLFDDEGSLAVHGERIASDLEEYVLPFLADYGSLGEYVETPST